MTEVTGFVSAGMRGTGSQDRGRARGLNFDGCHNAEPIMAVNAWACEGLALLRDDDLESMYVDLLPGVRMKSIATSSSKTAVESPRGNAVPMDDLSLAAQLPLDQVRRLCQAMAVELGLTPAGIERYGSWIDLIFTSTVLLRERHVLGRVSKVGEGG